YIGDKYYLIRKGGIGGMYEISQQSRPASTQINQSHPFLSFLPSFSSDYNSSTSSNQSQSSQYNPALLSPLGLIGSVDRFRGGIGLGVGGRGKGGGSRLGTVTGRFILKVFEAGIHIHAIFASVGLVFTVGINDPDIFGFSPSGRTPISQSFLADNLWYLPGAIIGAVYVISLIVRIYQMKLRGKRISSDGKKQQGQYGDTRWLLGNVQKILIRQLRRLIK
ncbi:MAG: hypothetical protein EZS28_047559, partial [Streblomastix strix]